MISSINKLLWIVISAQHFGDVAAFLMEFSTGGERFCPAEKRFYNGLFVHWGMMGCKI